MNDLKQDLDGWPSLQICGRLQHNCSCVKNQECRTDLVGQSLKAKLRKPNKCLYVLLIRTLRKEEARQ